MKYAVSARAFWWLYFFIIISTSIFSGSVSAGEEQIFKVIYIPKGEFKILGSNCIPRCDSNLDISGLDSVEEGSECSASADGESFDCIEQHLLRVEFCDCVQHEQHDQLRVAYQPNEKEANIWLKDNPDYAIAARFLSKRSKAFNTPIKNIFDANDKEVFHSIESKAESVIAVIYDSHISLIPIGSAKCSSELVFARIMVLLKLGFSQESVRQICGENCLWMPVQLYEWIVNTAHRVAETTADLDVDGFLDLTSMEKEIELKKEFVKLCKENEFSQVLSKEWRSSILNKRVKEAYSARLEKRLDNKLLLDFVFSDEVVSLKKISDDDQLESALLGMSTDYENDCESITQDYSVIRGQALDKACDYYLKLMKPKKNQSPFCQFCSSKPNLSKMLDVETYVSLAHTNNFPGFFNEQYKPFYKIPMLSGEGSMYRCKNNTQDYAEFYPVVVKVFEAEFSPLNSHSGFLNQFELLDMKENHCPDYFCGVRSQYYDPSTPPYCQVLDFLPYTVASVLSECKLDLLQSEFMLSNLFFIVWDLQVNNKMAHRDIKPGNLMFDAKGELKLVDLGLWVKVIDKEAVVPIAGTPGYVPMGESYNPFYHDRLSMVLTFIELRLGKYPDGFVKENVESYKASLLERLKSQHDKKVFEKLSKGLTLECATKLSLGEDLTIWLKQFYEQFNIDPLGGEIELLAMLLSSHKDGYHIMPEIFVKSDFLQKTSFLSEEEKNKMAKEAGHAW